ncbi:hypothetical protein VTL71DRAFT_9549 [Oculimacula yallundae]|uniref:Uncharacterized protein n=1 Tax=Oculimacula yallundae TaxID=86028 RepID=A0ABR4BS83_9HELO
MASADIPPPDNRR